jgi:hypothetical protein
MSNLLFDLAYMSGTTQQREQAEANRQLRAAPLAPPTTVSNPRADTNRRHEACMVAKYGVEGYKRIKEAAAQASRTRQERT